MSFQASYLPARLGEDVSKADLAVTPLRHVLAFKLGIEITAARETVSAVPLERRAARELGCRPGSAAFRSDRISLGPDGTPVVYDRVFIPGDRFRITRQLRYDTLDGHSRGGNDGPESTLEPTTEREAKEPGRTPDGKGGGGDVPLDEREAVRMSACAKEPGRLTGFFDARATRKDPA